MLIVMMMGKWSDDSYIIIYIYHMCIYIIYHVIIVIDLGCQSGMVVCTPKSIIYFFTCLSNKVEHTCSNLTLLVRSSWEGKG